MGARSTLQFRSLSADPLQTTSLAHRAAAEGTAALDPSTQAKGRRGGIPDWLLQLGLPVGLFLAGGLAGLVYSYVPLHNAKNWKIAWLEERLAAKDAVLSELEQRLGAPQPATAPEPQADALAALRAELAGSQRTASELEKKLVRAERRIVELERSRDSGSSRPPAKPAKTAKAAVEAEAGNEVPSQAGSAPAAPAALAGDGAAMDDFDLASRPRMLATGVVVQAGSRWASADGKAAFELVGVGDTLARIVPDPRSAPGGGAPSALELGKGSRFRVGLASGRSLQVTLSGLDPRRSVTIDVSE